MLTVGLVFVELVEKFFWLSTVNSACSMLQPKTMLPCRKQHVSWLKAAFIMLVESQSSHMLCVAFVVLMESHFKGER